MKIGIQLINKKPSWIPAFARNDDQQGGKPPYNKAPASRCTPKRNCNSWPRRPWHA